uniref:Ig-like domain-containing protein n=1 Tax=Salvator merianae TaxID=96440 RepID=A0A8D0BBJ3_SALMN
MFFSPTARKADEPSPPDVLLLHSSCSTDPSVEIQLVCHISGFRPRDIQVRWLTDAGSLPGDTEQPRQDAKGSTFSTTSTLNVSQSDWLEGKTYVCEVTHPATQQKLKSRAKLFEREGKC